MQNRLRSTSPEFRAIEEAWQAKVRDLEQRLAEAEARELQAIQITMKAQRERDDLQRALTMAEGKIAAVERTITEWEGYDGVMPWKNMAAKIRFALAQSAEKADG